MAVHQLGIWARARIHGAHADCAAEKHAESRGVEVKIRDPVKDFRYVYLPPQPSTIFRKVTSTGSERDQRRAKGAKANVDDIDKIDATRQTALTTSLASVTHQITRYSSSKTLCTTSWSNSRSHTTLSSTPLLPNPGNFACDARVLGTLMKSASMAGLLALKAPYTGVSFSGIAKKVRALSVEAMCDIVVLSPEQPLPAHGVKAAIEFSVEKSERMLCGLQLKEFKGVDEEVRLPLSHVFKFSAA